MTSIFVSSSEAYSGKSAFCLGLGLILEERGLKIGYMKPVGNLLVDIKGKLTDDDAWHAKSVFQLKDSLEIMSPVLLTENLIHDTLTNRKKGLSKRIRDSHRRLKRGKDIILFEGAGDVGGGAMFNLSDPEVAKMLNSKILLVSRYDSVYVTDRILNDSKIIKEKVDMLGVVFNDVPPEDRKKIQNLLVPFLEGKGIEVLGLIPRDALLKSVSVSDLAERLNAKVLVKGDNLVGSFLVGAMSPAHAINYFRRVTDKAIITGGDRSDILMAALETPTRCLILTGNVHPSKKVLTKASSLGVPVISVSHDTLTTVEIAESLVNRIRATEGIKLEKARELIKENVNLDRLFQKIGL